MDGKKLVIRGPIKKNNTKSGYKKNCLVFCSQSAKTTKLSILFHNFFYRFAINDDKTEWVPKDTMYSMDFDSNMDADVGVFFVNLGTEGAQNDEAVVRLLDENKGSSKMLTLKFSRRDGRISISESTRSSSFFFSSGDRDYEKANYEDLEIMSR